MTKVIGAFFSIIHSLANSGNNVWKSFSPTFGTRPLQHGHPTPLLLLFGEASHSWLHTGHNHQTSLKRFSVTSFGVSSPFFVGCHCSANTGLLSANDPRSATFPCVKVFPRNFFEHSGHPLLRFPPLWIIAVCHSCLQVLHIHQARSLEFMPNILGSKFPFFVGCHSAAKSGLNSISEFGITVRNSLISFSSRSRLTSTVL